MRNALRCTWIIAACIVATAAGCGKTDDRTPGQKLDSAIEKVERKTDELKARAEVGAEKAKVEVREAARAASEAVSDAAITARVKAELAKDPGLSALAIDVDTDAGRVRLRGSAPDDAARGRATALAAGVHGVSGVDNQLVVAPK